MKRMLGGIIVAVAIVAGCTPPGPGTAGTVYVTNERSGDLSVIDVFTQQVVATIPLGKRPRGLRASPDHSLLYVALSGSPIAGPGVDESTLPPADKSADGIGIVDLKSRRLLRILPGGSDPEQVAVSADGKTLFAANEDEAQITAIDAVSGKVLAEMKVGEEPEGVNLRPDGKEVYVTSENDGAVFVIDAVNPRVIQKIAVGHRPRSTTFSPNSSRAYVPAEVDGTVSVIDTATYSVVATVKLDGTEPRPMGGVISSDGKFLYMTTGRAKSVAIVDTAANRQVGSVEVGPRPWGIAISRDDKTLFTANGPSNDVSFVDIQGRAVKARVKVGDGPWGALFVP